MMDGIMDWARTLEKKRNGPQPRRHRCEGCYRIFICERCTDFMITHRQKYEIPMTCPKCVTHGGIKQNRLGYECSKCEKQRKTH